MATQLSAPPIKTLGHGRPDASTDELLNAAIEVAARRSVIERLCEDVMATGAFQRDIELRVWTDGRVEIA